MRRGRRRVCSLSLYVIFYRGALLRVFARPRPGGAAATAADDVRAEGFTLHTLFFLCLWGIGNDFFTTSLEAAPWAQLNWVSR